MKMMIMITMREDESMFVKVNKIAIYLHRGRSKEGFTLKY
jgi:hypothetical protein